MVPVAVIVERKIAMKPYIYITRLLPEEILSDLRKNYEVGMWHHEYEVIPQEILLKQAKHAQAILSFIPTRIDEDIFKECKELRVVANCAVGFDNIDVEAATKYGVAVCNTPDVLTDTTADLTFALLMATGRRLVEAAEFVKKGSWKGWGPFLLAGHDIHHKTIGIVGMGKIGEAVAKRAKGFDMTILYHNRHRKHEVEEKLGARYCTFEELIEKADFVVSLVPLTEETKHLFTRDVFHKMKRSAVFINASRGPVVDETSLYEALKKGEISAAGLDVFENEPISMDHPLIALPNVIALPHIGSASLETRRKMIELCSDNIISVLSGSYPKTLVNKTWKINSSKMFNPN
jgi:glyoxylate reductase